MNHAADHAAVIRLIPEPINFDRIQTFSLPVAPTTAQSAATGFLHKIGLALGARAEGPGAALLGLAVVAVVVIGAAIYFFRRR